MGRLLGIKRGWLQRLQPQRLQLLVVTGIVLLPCLVFGIRLGLREAWYRRASAEYSRIDSELPGRLQQAQLFRQHGQTATLIRASDGLENGQIRRAIYELVDKRVFRYPGNPPVQLMIDGMTLEPDGSTQTRQLPPSGGLCDELEASGLNILRGTQSDYSANLHSSLGIRGIARLGYGLLDVEFIDARCAPSHVLLYETGTGSMRVLDWDIGAYCIISGLVW